MYQMLLKKAKIKCLSGCRKIQNNSEYASKNHEGKKYFNSDRCDKSCSKKSNPGYRIAAVQKNSDKAVVDRLYIIMIYKKNLN